MRVPWTSRRSNQSILKEISPEYSLEGLMLKLKFMRSTDSLEKTLILGKMEDGRKEEKGTTEDEMVEWHHRLDGHEFEQAPELVMDREAWRAVVHGVAKNWT